MPTPPRRRDDAQATPGGRASGPRPTGLSTAEAGARLQQVGPNEIRRVAPTPWWRQFAAQFSSALVWLLLGACVVSVLLGEVADAIAIASIVLANAIVGYLQESRAEQALLALRALTAPRARAVRDGRSVMLPAAQVVPGDVLLLEAGDVIAADARLLEAHELRTSEAALTGESMPVTKTSEPVAPEALLAERRNEVFLGTAVATGTASAEVTATGMRTELGRIAHLLEQADESATPLQQRLAAVARTLLFLCLGIVSLVAVLGVLRGREWLELLMSSVSLAVAAVPEGLPAVVTVALALGVQRLVTQHVLVRRLPAVETLGSVTVVCTDKTGTLTTGAMSVRELWGADHGRTLDAAAACSDAELAANRISGTGDPTEVALLVAAAERGIERARIERERPRVEVRPFDSATRRMSILRADGRLYVKGAVEVLLPACVRGTDGAPNANAEMARRGLRVLAVATGAGPEERELELLGLVGIADPPRTEAIAAIADARKAGIRTVMITGDHPATAQAIATELGLLRAGEDPAEVVHARATAADKLEIVRSWKKRGEIVAMTGDGVNDAPALREAHIGIAMGRTGTEVTREAADIVLTNDDFASIIAAVREGRGIYENIRKSLVYLLAGNTGELLVMLVAGVAGLPLPLLPLHLLWINLVTDGFPALALVTDPPAPDLLDRAPRPPSEPMLGRRQWGHVAFSGAVQAACALGVFAWALETRGLAGARNLAFSTLVFGELLRAFASRSDTLLFWEVGAFTNVKLLAVVLVSALVQLGLHHIPASQALFQVSALSLRDCLLSVGIGLVPVTTIELTKLARRARGGAR
jgi:Ca2+-transporting ATPase